MRFNKWFILLSGLLIGLWISRASFGRLEYARELPESLKDRCNVCHISPTGGGPLNRFGEQFAMNDHSFPAIANADADGDGFTNNEELKSGTLPGDPQSHPGSKKIAGKISTNAQIGNNALLLGFLAVIFMLFTSALGIFLKDGRFLESARRSLLTSTLLVSIATLAMVRAFLTHDFQIQYVAQHSNRAMAKLYLLSGLWGGQEGSLLFWLFILSIYSIALIWFNRQERDPIFSSIVYGTLGIIQVFFYFLLVFITPPFRLLSAAPPDGAGLNPLLQNPAMLLHPPNLYLGYVGFSVPFAFAVASLATGKLDAGWLRKARLWVLIPWIFQTVGIILGGAWAYVELGWGGYWGWDPVENASFMPWLTATAFFHSQMISERKEMLKMWNVVLIGLTFWLSVLGTFITRSGLISSVHAFANTGLGAPFLFFLGLTAAIYALLIYYRYPLLQSREKIETVVSREGTFLLNNWVLLGITFAVLWGTLYPMISEWVTSKRGDVGAPFYNQVTVPLFLILLLLTGIGPQISWKKATVENLRRLFLYPLLFGLGTVGGLFIFGIHEFLPLLSYGLSVFLLVTMVEEFYRGTMVRKRVKGEHPVQGLFTLIQKNRRRYGGFIVHIGIALMAIGITASSAFKVEKEMVLAPGQSTSFLKSYTLAYQGLKEVPGPGYQEVRALIQMKGSREFLVHPAKRFYEGGREESSSETAILSTLTGDFYFILAGWDENENASVKAIFNPLVSWIWVGGIVVLLGSLIALTARTRKGEELL